MFTRDIKSLVQLGKNGVMWSDSPPKGPPEIPELLDAKKALAELKDFQGDKPDKQIMMRLLRQLHEAIDRLAKKNDASSKSIEADLANHIASEKDPAAKKVLEDIQKTRLESLAKAKESKETTSQTVTSTASSARTAEKREILWNMSIVKDYAQKINLGSALALLQSQTGSDNKAKAEAAVKMVKDSGVYYNGNNADTVKEMSGYTFREELSDVSKAGNEKRNQDRATESGKLISFLEGFAKLTPQAQAAILGTKEVSPDRKVDTNKLTDLIADFDDDGILEAINGVDKSSWWKVLTSIVGSSEAMQTQFFSEHDMAKMLEKNITVVEKYFSDTGITRGGKEDNKSWAKRLRTAIILQADMFGTGAIGAGSAEKMYDGLTGKKNLEERNKISEIFTEVEKTLKQNEKIKPADVSRIARELTNWVVRTQFSLGAGSLNLNELTKIVTDPRDVSLLSMDYTAMVRLFNSPNLKLNGLAGVGAGLTSGNLIPFAHIGANAKVTFADRADLENLIQNLDEGKANVTTTLGANVIPKMKKPVVNVDLLWNDRIDQSENAVTHMAAVVDDMLTLDTSGNPSLDLTRIGGKNMHQSMRDMLTLLGAAIVDGTKELQTPQDKMAHAALLRNKFLNAFELYVNNHPNMKGAGLAGITFIAIPGAIGFGPVFQNVGVTRTAREVTQSTTKSVETQDINTVLANLGLSYDKNLGVLKAAANADRSKVKLPVGMSFDASGTVNLGADKSPKFAVDAAGFVTITLTEGVKSSKTSTVTSKVELLEKEGDLPSGATESIRTLSINKLIERADVKAFMLAMMSPNGDPLKVAKKIKEFAPILALAGKGGDPSLQGREERAILLEIDEKLVGDLVTRLFNDAKTDDKAFGRYKALLKSRGVNVSKLTRENMTVGDIAKASFDKPGLRNQELALIAKASGLDLSLLAQYDQELIGRLGAEKNLKTEGSGLMLMARNRAAKGLQGARQYENGSYISRKDMNLSTAQRLEVATKMLGDDLRKMALVNIASRPEFKDYSEKIATSDSKINGGKITIALSATKSLTIDLTQTQVASALYGDTSMENKGQGQAVCINCALLVEPKVSAVLTDTQGVTTVVPTMEVTSRQSQMVFDGEAYAEQMSIVGYRKERTKKGDSGSVPGDENGLSDSLPRQGEVTRTDPNAVRNPPSDANNAGAVNRTNNAGEQAGIRGTPTNNPNPSTPSNNSGAVPDTTDGGVRTGKKANGSNSSISGIGVIIDNGKIDSNDDENQES